MDKNEVIEGEIMDAKAGEMIPRGATEMTAHSAEMQVGVVALATIGTLVISEDARKVLEEKLDPNDVRIRPNDGIVYVPWTYYAGRLNRAFGIAGWGLVPDGKPMQQPHGKGVLVVWGHHFIINGVYIGYAIGETTYQPTNPKMSFADACEGAKSNSLARNCKLLGMTLELWDHEYAEEWKRKYATKLDGDWVKKRIQAPSTAGETAGTKAAGQTPPPPPPSKEQKAKDSKILAVKKAWVAAAIKKGVMIDAKDQAGVDRLIAILGTLYKTLRNENADKNLVAGLKIIEDWKPQV